MAGCLALQFWRKRSRRETKVRDKSSVYAKIAVQSYAGVGCVTKRAGQELTVGCHRRIPNSGLPKFWKAGRKHLLKD
jgi:hypothetical protein